MDPVENVQSSLTEELLRRLKDIDRRSRWELGLGVSVLTVMTAMIASAVAGVRNFDITVSAPAPLFFGALMLLLLFTWLLHERTRKSYVAQFNAFLQEARIREHRDISLRDSLTGLFNRAALEEFAGRAVKRAERSDSPLTLAIFDLDNFHEMNNQFGHLAGDLALTQFAGILQGATRGSDFVARYGGDEFILLLPDTAGAGYEVVLGRIRQRLDARNAGIGQDEAPLFFTAGKAESRKDTAFAELFAEADHDLLSQKRARTGAHGARQ